MTKREFDDVIVWNEYLHAKDSKKLKKLKPKDNIRNNPPQKEEKTEEEKKPAAWMFK